MIYKHLLKSFFVETISDFVAPSVYNVANQQFWKDIDRNTYFMMHIEKLYWYDFINLTWTNYSVSISSPPTQEAARLYTSAVIKPKTKPIIP